jgi:hypothetical protein
MSHINRLNEEVNTLKSKIIALHREDYVRHAIDIIMKYIDLLNPKETAFAIKELFFIGTLNPLTLEGYPSFSIEGPARMLYVLEDEVDKFQEIIDELRDIAPDSIENILDELHDYIEGIFDGFGI